MNKIFAFFSDHKNLALFLTLASTGILAFAYISQYVFHYDPCPLCLWQRKPYLAVIVLALGAFVLRDKSPKKAYVLLMLCGMAFLAGVGIAGFHNGVEQGWWEGLKSCGDTQLPDGASLEELREYLNNRKIVDCRVPIWKLFGLSMTAYNLMMSVGLAGFTFFFAYKGRKKI